MDFGECTVEVRDGERVVTRADSVILVDPSVAVALDRDPDDEAVLTITDKVAYRITGRQEGSGQLICELVQ
jgi:hypothetical protein